MPLVQSTRLPAGEVVAAGAALTVSVAVAVDTHPNALVTVYVIGEVPADTVVTVPDPPPIVATAGVPLVHTPPGVVLDSVVDEPLQRASVPVTGATAVGALTVTTVVAAPAPQTFVTVYEMVLVPLVAPVTTPVELPTVATAGTVLLHTPPGVALLSVPGVPMQMIPLPVIGAGTGVAFTVTTAVTGPEATLYVIVVVPAETPVTIPDADPIVATAGVLDVQVPPGVASASVVVPVTHTVNVPVIGAVVAPGFTVKLFELMFSF